MVLLGVLRAPEHLQVAGHAAGRLHDHGVRPDQLVERAEDLGLRRQRLVAEVEGLVDDAVPPVLVLGVGLHVGVVDPVAGQSRR